MDTDETLPVNRITFYPCIKKVAAVSEHMVLVLEHNRSIYTVFTENTQSKSFSVHMKGAHT